MARRISAQFAKARQIAREERLTRRAAAIGAGILPASEGRRKFHNTRTVYNGQTYDSMGEAEYAAKLDLRCKAGELVDWERPKPVVLMQAQQARGRITYRPDFYVVPATGTGYYVDYKGSSVTETAVWKLKVKLWRSAVPHELRVVYASGEEKIVATGNECFTKESA